MVFYEDVIPGRKYRLGKRECVLYYVTFHGRSRWAVVEFEDDGVSKIGIRKFCEKAFLLPEDR